MGKDSIEYEILEDGTIKWTTGQVSAANHSNADRFLAEVGRLMGGETQIERRQDVTAGRHTHGHGHTHTH